MSTDPLVLILGDTTEAIALADAVAEAGLRGIVAHGGRRRQTRPLPLPVRIGGFGGAKGLARYVVEARITHMVDATRPFTRTISQLAIAAAAETGLPLLALTRPAWRPGEGDNWRAVAEMDAAVAALEGDPQRVFLDVDQRDVARFARQPQHHYLLRLGHAARSAPPLPNHEVLLGSGPFDLRKERAMLKAREIGLIVTRNSGAPKAQAKLDAARALGLPVLMIDRPSFPERREVAEVAAVIEWINGTEKLSAR